MAKKKAKAAKPAATVEGLRDLETLRASVGSNTLAMHVLDSLESSMRELEHTYVRVAALGESLRVAREQLAEQEDELESLRDQS
jgi:hypothetical protein